MYGTKQKAQKNKKVKQKEQIFTTHQIQEVMYINIYLEPVSAPSEKRLQTQKQIQTHKSNKDITKVINKNIEHQMMQIATTHK